MLVSDRVYNNPHICGIQVDLSAKEFASGNFDVQPFYNTNISEGNFKKVYYSIGSASFKETTSQNSSGILFKQKVTIKLPSLDKNRSQRIEEFRKIKFLAIKLSDGKKIILGRNDFFVNAKPRISISSTEKSSQIQFTTYSIFPVGFFEGTAAYGYVYELPISFLENI